MHIFRGLPAISWRANCDEYLEVWEQYFLNMDHVFFILDGYTCRVFTHDVVNKYLHAFR